MSQQKRQTIESGGVLGEAEEEEMEINAHTENVTKDGKYLSNINERPRIFLFFVKLR